MRSSAASVRVCHECIIVAFDRICVFEQAVCFFPAASYGPKYNTLVALTMRTAGVVPSAQAATGMDDSPAYFALHAKIH